MMVSAAVLGLVMLGAAAMGAKADGWRSATLTGGAVMLVVILAILVPFIGHVMALAPGLTLIACLPVFLLGGLCGMAGQVLPRWLKVRRLGVLTALPALGLTGLLVLSCTQPSAQASVPWPDRAAKVSVQIWAAMASEEWWLSVATPQGRLSQKLGENWGPATRANIYRTPAGAIAAIYGAELTGPITLGAEASPRPQRANRADEADWVYLGAVLKRGRGEMAFVSAAKLPECIDLYGIGSVPVRPAFQASPCR